MKGSQTLNGNSSLRLHLNLLSWVLLAFVVPTLGQTSRLFQWRFGDNFLSRSLPTCVNLPIIVESWDVSTNDTHGTPPFYMIAFVVGGTPVTTFIGTDENNLSWTVAEPVGSELVLSVVDANGSAGGIPPMIYTVIAGQTTQCITTPLATPEFKITTNVTRDLSTCQPWGFTITGGVPPYIITLPALNSPVVTNATIAFGDISFTYINRVQPGTRLLGAVSDFTGRWADGTAMVKTRGSADTACRGLVSSSGNSVIQQQEAAATSYSATSHLNQRYTIIVAVSVTLSLFVIGLSIAIFIYLRRRKQAVAQFDEITARPFGEGRLLSVNKYLASTSNRALSIRKAVVTRTASPMQPRSPSPPPIPTDITSVSNYTQARASQVSKSRLFSLSDYSFVDDTSTNSSRSTYSLPSFAHFPLTSVRAPQNLNRGPGARIGAVNPDRRDSCDEGLEYIESYFNEPALSDSGSSVLPRSLRRAAVRRGRSRIVVAHPQQVKGPRHHSEGSRILRDSPSHDYLFSI